MSTQTNGAPQSINPKLINLAVILVIICAVAFLGLWAVPTFTQKAEDTKNQAIANAEKTGKAGKAVADKMTVVAETALYKMEADKQIGIISQKCADSIVPGYRYERAEEASLQELADAYAIVSGSSFRDARMSEIQRSQKVRPTYLYKVYFSKKGGNPSEGNGVYAIYRNKDGTWGSYE